MVQRDHIVVLAFLIPTLILIFLLFFYPLASTIWLSLTYSTRFEREPKFVGLENYIRIINTPVFWNITKNSVIWTGVVVLFQFLIGLGTALLLNQKFKFRSIARALLIIPWAMPGAIAGYLWKFLFDTILGPINWSLMSIGLLKEPYSWLGTPSTALWGVIVAAIWKGFPFSMLMYLAALQSVPKELLDAAKTDGASFFQELRYVVIPTITPVIKITVLLTIIWTFNYFDLVWVMTGGGPEQSSHIFPTYIYLLGFGWFLFGEASVYAVVDFLILGIFTILFLRQVTKGWIY
ncbi:Inner membrane ABC transporter permease protein YcjO [archaeon HR06]|nr:Inner membrane ABC transporter permease protein YcjO [archaeon HR06]